jgi:hypothetical protein
VLESGVVVGRIFKEPAAPHGRPWMWASGHSAATVKRAAHGYEPTREAAMAAFAKSWRRTLPLSGKPDIGADMAVGPLLTRSVHSRHSRDLPIGLFSY